MSAGAVRYVAPTELCAFCGEQVTLPHHHFTAEHNAAGLAEEVEALRQRVAEIERAS